MPAPLDIVCFYADLGRPYLQLIQNMTLSAKEAMPFARTVLLTPTPSDELRACFDRTVTIKAETTDKTVCLDKARAILSWQSQSVNKVVYVDPDIEFMRPVAWGHFDVGLLWRKTKIDQPINTGLILARPGCPDFWTRYSSTVTALPKELHSWWGDQFGFALMLGSEHQAGDVLPHRDARVGLIDWRIGCATPEKADPHAWAHHYKGARKGDWVRAYHEDRQLQMAG